jgi:hypothetical protein
MMSVVLRIIDHFPDTREAREAAVLANPSVETLTLLEMPDLAPGIADR